MSDATTKHANEPTSADRPRSRKLKRFVAGLAALLIALLVYLFLWPSPIDPVAYEPPPKPPLEGPLAPNDRLADAEWLAVGKVDGPEDIEVDAQGRIFTGTADGKLVRIDPDGTITALANTGGRPVGIAAAADGKLIVADAVKGLLSIDPAGQITTLVTGTASDPLGFADDVDVARDGTIYFSDASSKFGAGEFLYDMLEGRPHGRLLRYEPTTKETSVVVSDLCFANGVALSQHEDFVLVVETYRFRIMRHWLTGDRAGTTEVFVDNLPGYPDNVTSNRHGTFWLALFTVRNDDGDWLSPRPFVKGVLAKLPSFLWPKPQPYGFIIKLDETGQIVDSLQDPTGSHLYEITSAVEHDGYLYLGSLHNNRIGKYKLP